LQKNSLSFSTSTVVLSFFTALVAFEFVLHKRMPGRINNPQLAHPNDFRCFCSIVTTLFGHYGLWYLGALKMYTILGYY